MKERLLPILLLILSVTAQGNESETLNIGNYVGKIYSDGSGSLGKKFDPNSTLGCKSFSCEYKRKNADATTSFDDTWSFHIRNDEMSDKQIITVARHPHKISKEFGEMKLKSSIYLWLNLSGKNQELLCIAGHDFPGLAAMIRVDDNKAIETNEKGCLILSRELDDQLMAGKNLTIRGSHWPYKSPETTNKFMLAQRGCPPLRFM
jgi:hypothetical protein